MESRHCGGDWVNEWLRSGGELRRVGLQEERYTELTADSSGEENRFKAWKPRYDWLRKILP